MNDLVSSVGLVEKNGVKMMSSKSLAEMFDKRHDNVLEKIRNTLESLGSLDSSNQTNSRYYIEHGDNNSKTYFLDEGLSSLIAGKYSDTYALKVHDFFVEKKKKAPTLPTDYISALEALLDSKKAEQKAIAQREFAHWKESRLKRALEGVDFIVIVANDKNPNGGVLV